MKEKDDIEELNDVGAVRYLVEGFIHVLGLDGLLTYSKVMQNTLFVLFLLGIGIFHVFNTHSAERMVRNIARKEQKIKELRWEYTSVKSDMMFKSKQTELETQLAPYGLQPLVQPPYKIVVKKNEY